jgi:uncharacterized protein
MFPNRLLPLLLLSSLSSPLLASGFFGPPLSGRSSASTPKSSSQPSSSTSSSPAIPADSTVTTLQNLSSQPAPSTTSAPASDSIPAVHISSTYGDLDDLAQTRAATPDQVKEYIALTHAVQQTRQLMQTMTQGMERNAASYLPKSFWDDFHASLDKIDLQAALISAYQKYFSQQDMEQILAFYRTPAGQHFASVQPLIGSVSEDTVRKVTADLGNQVATRHASEINAAKRKYEEGAAKRTSSDDAATTQNTAARQEAPAK